MLLGFIVLLALVFTVLRPLGRQLAGTLRAPELSPDAPALPGMVGGVATGEGALAVFNGSPAARSTGSAYEDQIAQARALVNEDPARVAQVVKKWVANDA
jgi:flagellar M-ring protein FliF